jgi:hypothetical protein
MRFFWKLPSWLFHASLDKVGILYAYMVSVNVFESLLVLFGLIVLGFILPRQWFLEHFITKGLLLVLLSLGSLMYFDYNIQAESAFPLAMFRWSPVFVLFILLLVFLLHKIALLRAILEKSAANLVVFLYVSIPVSAISVVLVLMRNLF